MVNGRFEPCFELFEALYPNQPWFVFHDPGWIGLDLCCVAAFAPCLGFVTLHIGKGCNGGLTEQRFLLVAGWAPPGSVEEGPFGLQLKAEGLLPRIGWGKRIGRDGPVARGCFLGTGSAASPTGCTGAAKAEEHRAEGDQESGAQGANRGHGC